MQKPQAAKKQNWLELPSYIQLHEDQGCSASSVPEKEEWRLGLLTSLLKLRSEKNLKVEDSRHVINILCAT